MELQETNTTSVAEPQKPKNPAKKWLIVSACGLFICLAALGYHYLSGNANGGAAPLPKTVLRQVFGFTPYYFVKNTPPDNLGLQKNSSKFIGNALSFNLLDTKKRVISISQKSADGVKAQKPDGESFETNLGTSIINQADGKITATLTTGDKTIINLEAPDTVSSTTLMHIYNSLTPTEAGAAIPVK